MRRMVVIIVILLSSMEISVTHGSNECSPSICGNQSIRYPFTLRGDPSNCIGDEKYKLSCIGSKTFMAAPYDNYLVTGIFYNNYTINMVNTDLASGRCNLPSQVMTPNFFPKGFDLGEAMWIVFINCSENLDSDLSWTAVSCLSQNNRFIYAAAPSVGIGELWIGHLPKSCTYLTMVPTTYSIDHNKTGDDIFGTMKNEFTLSWTASEETTLSKSEIIHHCVNKAVRRTKKHTDPVTNYDRIKFLLKLECEFVYCAWHSRDSILFGSSIVFALFVDIIFLYSVIIIPGRLIIAPLCIHVFLLYELFKMLSPMDYVEIFLRNQQQTTLTRYVYTDIVAMTSHFKDQLGQGGFGTVYKGELPGAYLVAVKLLGKSNDNGEDFISEVSTIGTIHHTNVVRLIGFCSEGLHRALVYEYMYNGSLDKYIFSSTRKFTTTKLNEIAIGVARGIDYLHRGCNMRILHFDITPHNILLDGNFNPKVSDFGLAKLYSKDISLVSTFAARGIVKNYYLS